MAFPLLPRWRHLTRRPACIGLDIAAAGVRAVAVHRDGHRYHVNALAGPANNAGTSCLDPDGHLGELEPLVDLCRNVIADIGKASVIAMTLPLSAATCVRLTLPASSSPSQRWRQIRAELAAYLPYPVDDAALDYCALPTSSHPDDVEVTVVAIPQSMIEERLALAEALQLPVSAIGVDAWMVSELIHSQPRNRHCAIVHASSDAAWIALPDQPPALLAWHTQAALLKEIALHTGNLVEHGKLQRLLLCGDDPDLATLAVSLRKYAGIPALMAATPPAFQPENLPNGGCRLAAFQTAFAAAAGGLV